MQRKSIVFLKDHELKNISSKVIIIINSPGFTIIIRNVIKKHRMKDIFKRIIDVGNLKRRNNLFDNVDLYIK